MSRLRLLERAEVFPDVRLRSEQPLFFARPQREADGAARPDADRLQDP
jgi:hypothetical protein